MTETSVAGSRANSGFSSDATVSNSGLLAMTPYLTTS